MQATSPRFYETVFISPPHLGEDAVEKVIQDVQDAFVARGAEIVRIERWGRRRLAYRIAKQNEGWYVLLQVKGPSGAVEEVERKMRINEDVIKYLTVRLDDVAGAVQHASDRIVRLAREEEERKIRAAERAQREEERSTTPDDVDMDDDDQEEP